jgi:hypothetical protein
MSSEERSPNPSRPRIDNHDGITPSVLRVRPECPARKSFREMDAALPRPPLPFAFVAGESFRRFPVDGRRGQDPHSTEQRDYQLLLGSPEVAILVE